MKQFIRSLLLFVMFFPALVWGTPQNITGFETGNAPATTTEFNFVGTTQSIQSTTVIDGNFSLQTNPATSAVGYVSMAFSGNNGQPTSFNVADLYFGFYWRVGTLPSSGSEEFVATRRSGAEQMTLRVNSSGNILMFQNSDLVTTPVWTSTATVSTGTNYFIRMRVQTSTTGAYSFDIYDMATCTLIENQAGTANFGTQNSEGIRLGKVNNRNSQTVNFYYDNLIWDDASLPACGGLVRNMKPDADGGTQNFTSGTGATFAEVDDTLPSDGDTTYVMNTAAATVGNFNLESSASAGISGTIRMAKAWSWCRENSTVTSSRFLRMISGGTTTDNSTGFNGTTAYAEQHKTYAVDPDTTAAWTTSGLDAVQVGIREANAVQDRCSAFGMQVYFEPPPATATPTPTATPTVTPTATATPTPAPVSGEKNMLLLGVG